MAGKRGIQPPTDRDPMTTHDQRRSNTGHWGLFTALVAGVWLLAGTLEGVVYVLTMAGKGKLGSGHFWWDLAAGLSGFWALAALLSPPLIWAARRARFEQGRRWRAAGLYAIALLVFVVVQGTVRTLWKNATDWHKPFDPRYLLRDIPAWVSNEVGGAMLVFVGVVGAVFAWDYYQRYRERERVTAALELEQARLRASLSEARLEALQMQLQPHFLFNALHAISTLILKGETRGANEMLSHLSRFLRMTLDSADSPTVPLAIELDSLDAYLRVQRERFRDRLHVAMEIDEQALSAAVPNLVFQPLVENSIRHGIASDVGSGSILVRAAVADGRLRLEVEDDGRGLPEGETGNGGIGLRNIRERLEQLYPGDHEFTLAQRPAGGTLARIVIPFRPAERGSTSRAH